ncbi:MAG: hypothetical protein ACRD8O_14240 [Bryobacteraceae bacterium]
MCSLAPTGELSAKEARLLGDHLEQCDDCRRSLTAYSEALHKIGALVEEVQFQDAPEHFGDRTEAWQHLMAAIQRDDRRLRVAPIARLRPDLSAWRGRAFAFVSLILLLGAGSLAYQWRREVHQRDELRQRNAKLVEEIEGLRRSDEQPIQKAVQAHSDSELGSMAQDVVRLTRQSREQILALSNAEEGRKVALESAAEWRSKASLLSQELENLSAEMTRGHAERAGLASRLKDALSAVEASRKEFAAADQSRLREQENAASLRLRLTNLDGLAEERQQTIEKQQRLLATDRDIRELMGARNLHIIDVYDVNVRGDTERAFGRVFYTEGKSLVFYAFDLHRVRGLKPESTFQAWGQRDSARDLPLNLGILYVDNTAQNRWALRFDDPATLKLLDAVYVTIEPSGRSSKIPHGSKLLYAYLRNKPNHP